MPRALPSGRVIAASVMLLLPFAARAQWLGPIESPGDPPSLGVSGDQQRQARIDAFDGGYWVVWSGNPRATRYVDVYGARLDATGRPQGNRIPIGVYAYDDWSPNVRCASTVCLAAWSRDDAIVATRLSPTGSVLDQPPIVLSVNTFRDQVEPYVDLEGESFVVAWGEGGQLGRTRVSASGQVRPVERRPAAYGWVFSGARSGLTQYFATEVGNDVQLLVFDEDGGVLSSVAGTGNAPLIARAGGDVLVGWSASVSGPFSTRPYSLSGGPRSPEVVNDPLSSRLFDLKALGTSTDVLVLYSRGSAVWAALDSPLRPFNPVQVSPTDLVDARFDSSAQALVVKPVARKNELLFATLSDAGLSLGSTSINRSGASHRAPSIVASLDGGAVAYRADSEDSKLKVVFIDASGEATGAPIELDPSTEFLASNQVAIVDGLLNVAWLGVGSSSLRWATVTSSGAVTSKPALTNDATGGFCLGAGSDLMVAGWGESDGVLRGRFVTGGVPGPLTTLLPRGRHCAIAGTRGSFLVASTSTDKTVRFALIARDAGQLASGEVESADQFQAFQGEIGAAAGNGGFLVAWAAQDATLSAALLTQDGGTLSARLLKLFDRADYADLPQTEGRLPSVVFDGEAYVVAWDSAFVDGGANVFSRRISEEGGVGPIVMLASGPFDEEMPSLAVTSAGRLLVAYVGYEPLPGADAQRLRTRVVANVPNDGFCSRDLECRVGRCVSNRCCTGACDAGVMMDGGAASADAGANDAGMGDADGGTASDGGTPDAGTGTTRRFEIGCGCNEGLRSSVLLLAAVAGWRWRRRRSPAEARRRRGAAAAERSPPSSGER